MFKKVKDILTGFVIGVLFCGIVSTGIAALPQDKSDREFNKFQETSDNRVAVLISIVE